MKVSRSAMQPGQATCGAKTRKGSPCKDIAMANGRCKRHGGKSTGAGDKQPIGAANGAYTHGIYTKFFRNDEKALIDEGAIRLGQVDTELTIVRIRLKRALEAKENWETDLLTGDGEDSTVLVEVVNDESVSKDGDVVPTEKRSRRLPPFDDLIDRCLARIESLEKTRKELMKTGEGDDDLPEGAEQGRDHVTFTGGLDGGSDAPLPSPFAKPK